jgi:hypothetical protein
VIDRIAAQNRELNIAELVKTITIYSESVHYKIEIYYAHDLAASRPYFALGFREADCNKPDNPTSVWHREHLFPSCEAATLEECLKLAVETTAQDPALHTKR